MAPPDDFNDSKSWRANQSESRKPLNVAWIVANGQLIGSYAKHKLPNYGVFDEKRYFHPGENIPVYQLNGVLFGVNICEDIWRERSIVKHQADEDAQFIINISASPYHMGKANVRKNILKERVKETGTFICYNNLVGGQDELVFDGLSLVLDSNGKELAVGRDRKSTRLNSSHTDISRMPSSA